MAKRPSLTKQSSHSASVRFADLPDWLSVPQATQYLQLGRVAFANRLKAGEIPYRQFGRRIRIPKAALRP